MSHLGNVITNQERMHNYTPLLWSQNTIPLKKLNSLYIQKEVLTLFYS